MTSVNNSDIRWLSKPVRTLRVPSLVHEGGIGDDGGGAFKPGSVLMLLAGTGVVALPQILHHRDPLYKLGISTPKRDQLHVPIDAVLSFREDDVLGTNGSAPFSLSRARSLSPSRSHSTL